MASTLEALLLAQVSTAFDNTPQLVSTTTLGSPAASVTYTVVTPYQRILCVWNAASTRASNPADSLLLRVNGSSSNAYASSYIQSVTGTVTGTATGSLVSSIQVGTITASTATLNYWASGSFVVDGANTSSHNTTVQGTACAFPTASSSYVGVYSGMYVAGTPVTSVTLLAANGNINTGSSFSFYGLT